LLGGYRWHLEVGHVDWFLPRIRRAANLVSVCCFAFPLKDILKMGLSLSVVFKWWGCDLFAEFKVYYVYTQSVLNWSSFSENVRNLLYYLFFSGPHFSDRRIMES